MSSEQTKPYYLQQLRERLLVALFPRWLHIYLLTLIRSELIPERHRRDEIVSNLENACAPGGILSRLIDQTRLVTILASEGTARALNDLHMGSTDLKHPARRALLVGLRLKVSSSRAVEALMLPPRRIVRRCLGLTMTPFASRQSQQADCGQKLRRDSNLPSGAQERISASNSTFDWSTNYVPATCLASVTSARPPERLCGNVALYETILIANEGRLK